MLADMMLNGRGGPKDHAAALALFEKAAEAGHVGAMFAVGAMMGGGHEVPTDRVAAQTWFRAAAERGHPYAQMMLGRFLARNLAGEHNPTEARRLAGTRGGAGPAGRQGRPRRAAAGAERDGRRSGLTHRSHGQPCPRTWKDDPAERARRERDTRDAFARGHAALPRVTR